MSDAASDSDGAGPLRFPPRRVDVHAIERELEEMLGPSRLDGHDAVTRAAMSNVIVYCENDAQAEPISGELAEILGRHPSRVLLLVAEAEDAGAEIEASVSAQCNLGAGGRQICEEHVLVRAAPGAARRLPSTVRPLLIGDLPTGLWWVSPDPPSERDSVFGELTRMADQVIYDSDGWQERQLTSALDWIGHGREEDWADLAWPRLLPWRRALAEAFDPARRPGALEAIERVTVDHGPHALPQAWLLVGWLADRLGWRVEGGTLEEGVAITWRLSSPAGGVEVSVRRSPRGDSALRSVAVESRDGAASRFEATGGGRLRAEVEPEAAPRIFALRERPRVILLADLLSERSGDPFFREALDVSRALARVVGG